MNLNETKTFTLDIIGESTGQKFFGVFDCYRRLSHGKQIAKDRIIRELLGANAQDASKRAQSQAEIIASLQVSLAKYPDWLKESKFGFELADDNVLAELDNQISKIQAEAILEVQKKAEESKEALKESLKKVE